MKNILTLYTVLTLMLFSNTARSDLLGDIVEGAVNSVVDQILECTEPKPGVCKCSPVHLEKGALSNSTTEHWDKCKGEMRFAGGSKYVGEFKDGNLHGHGTFTYANGDKYVGEHKDSSFYGQGTFTYANGDKYVGEFKDTNFHGYGALTLAEGISYVGEWKDSKKHGHGTLTHADGKVVKGLWENDEMIKTGNKQEISEKKLKEQYESYFIIRKCHDMSPLLISYQELKEAKQYIRAIDDFYKSEGVDTDMVYKRAEENPSKNVKSLMGSMDFITLAGGSYSQEMKMACNIHFRLINKPEKPKGKKDF